MTISNQQNVSLKFFANVHSIAELESAHPNTFSNGAETVVLQLTSIGFLTMNRSGDKKRVFQVTSLGQQALQM